MNSAFGLPRCGEQYTLPDGMSGEILWKRVRGSVVVAGLRLVGGRYVTAVIQPHGEDRLKMAVHSADVTAAEALAELVVAGADPQMPVTSQIHLLAAAVLARREVRR